MSEAMTTTTPTTPAAIEKPSPVEWGKNGLVLKTMDDAWRFALAASRSGMFKGVTTPEQAFMKMQAGAELGMTPFASMTQVHLIEGTPVISAIAMLARIKREGGGFKIIAWDSTICEIEWWREERGEWTAVGRSKWTIEMARTAQLTTKGPWIKTPDDMLRARCVGRGARAFFSDFFSGGIMTEDEAEELITVRSTPTVATRGEDAVRAKLAAKVEDIADAEVVTAPAAPIVEVAAADAPATKRTRKAKEPGEASSVAAAPAPVLASPTLTTDPAHGAPTSTTAPVSVASPPAYTSGPSEVEAADPTPAPTPGASASTPTPSTSTVAPAPVPSSSVATAPPSSPASSTTSTPTGDGEKLGGVLALAIAEMKQSMTSKDLMIHMTSHQSKLSVGDYAMLMSMGRAVSNRQKGYDLESGMDAERLAAFKAARAFRPNPIDDPE